MKFRSRRSELDVWPIMADLFSGLMLAMLVLLLVEMDDSELTRAQNDRAKAEAELRRALAELKLKGDEAKTANDNLKSAAERAKAVDERLEQCEGPVNQLQTAVKDAKRELERHLGAAKVRSAGVFAFTIDSEQLFESGKADVKPEGRTELRKICKAMVPVFAKHKKIQLIIEGHTDDVPLSAGHFCADNHELSWFRARAIRSEFLAFRDHLGDEACSLMGGNEHRVVAVGYGEARPLAREATQTDDDWRKKNRRAEFRLDKLEDGTAAGATSQAK